VEQYLISTIDHGFNASTFTARVITSTGADLAAAVTGAIGALSGPLHGGAPSRALDMLDSIGTIDNAEPWLRDAVGRGDRLMGFGHRVYKTDDPVPCCCAVSPSSSAARSSSSPSRSSARPSRSSPS
jgi:citrate synthase